MPFLSAFKRGDRVFVADSPSEWVGVEVVRADKEAGTVKVQIVFTNDIPGYELNDEIEVSEGVLAHRELTVDAVINHYNTSA